MHLPCFLPLGRTAAIYPLDIICLFFVYAHEKKCELAKVATPWQVWHHVYHVIYGVSICFPIYPLGATSAGNSVLEHADRQVK